jgi:copper(I)-binding protein
MRSSLRRWRAALCALMLATALMTVPGNAARTAEATEATEAAAVQIKYAWIRWLPANLPAGGYATLRNAGAQPVILRGVSSPDYGEVSLHRSLIEQGRSLMQPVAQISLPAHTDLSLAAAGYHIMLQQPTRALKPGDRVAIALRFADGSSTLALFELRKPDAQPPHP